MRTLEAQHLAANLPAPSDRSTVTTHDPQAQGSGPPALGTPPHFHGPASGGRPPSPTGPTSGLARSLSQPSLNLGLPSASPSELRQTTSTKREHDGRPVVPGPPFPAPISASRPFGARGALGDVWGPGPLSSLPAGASRNLQIAEGHALFAITPTHGEEIVVPVDTHHASRQADQKRQRNAGASARFRQRKKEREREQQEEMQKLENENRELGKKNEELAKRCQELEAERDFYRNERNRLRDLISKTPGMTDSYVDPSGLEPPARRRRTDSEPHLPTSSYSLVTSTHLPPITSPAPPAAAGAAAAAFGVPPSPHLTPPPAGVARLPPLRFDQSRTPSTTPPPIATVPPPPAMPPQPSDPYATTSRRPPYEAGWATDPRGPTDGGPR
ncbi:40600fc8-f346-48ec-be27-59b678a4a725 [Thermothielavioides terrestris]|uniref:40600fc8-f346-48ec-be27-59b678a4a725 n=1 Tax=Thermothielavioides terrestris TaxID=2587410 RepID=A0A3S4AP09_9PEZI|nr:40600fc8-f346-48ec-be27-59b678a4a725 [Thermothielavioides terrestris]